MSIPVIQPFPALSTDRLQLRQPELSDAPAIFAIRANDQVNKHLDREPAKTVDDARAFIEKINAGIARNEAFYWVITFEETLIGTICLWQFSEKPSKAEIGFELHPDFQGKGFMQEALAAVLEFGFSELKLNFIEGYTNLKNAGSIKLMEKLGFVNTRVLLDENAVIYTRHNDSLT